MFLIDGTRVARDSRKTSFLPVNYAQPNILGFSRRQGPAPRRRTIFSGQLSRLSRYVIYWMTRSRISPRASRASGPTEGEKARGEAGRSGERLLIGSSRTRRQRRVKVNVVLYRRIAGDGVCIIAGCSASRCSVPRVINTSR